MFGIWSTYILQMCSKTAIIRRIPPKEPAQQFKGSMHWWIKVICQWVLFGGNSWGISQDGWIVRSCGSGDSWMLFNKLAISGITQAGDIITLLDPGITSVRDLFVKIAKFANRFGISTGSHNVLKVVRLWSTSFLEVFMVNCCGQKWNHRQSQGLDKCSPICSHYLV